MFLKGLKMARTKQTARPSSQVSVPRLLPTPKLYSRRTVGTYFNLLAQRTDEPEDIKVYTYTDYPSLLSGMIDMAREVFRDSNADEKLHSLDEVIEMDDSRAIEATIIDLIGDDFILQVIGSSN